MKTGFIYCPYHSPYENAAKRREKIEAMLRKYEIDYDLVQSEQQQSVSRLVSMMINNGYENIIIIGGDRALNDAVNCLMKVERQVRSRINLGVIPNGAINDFASFWGFSRSNIEQAVKSIKNLRIRTIDVGCLRYIDKENNDQQKYFLNCVNVGLLARIHALRQNTRRALFSRKLSYAASLFLMLFNRMVYEMQYTINGNTENRVVMTLCVGSAWGYHQTPSAVPYNGMLDVTVVRHSALTQLFNGIYLFLKGKFLNYKRVKLYRTRNVEIKSQKPLPVSVDGQPVYATNAPLRIDIKKEEINFIIE